MPLVQVIKRRRTVQPGDLLRDRQGWTFTLLHALDLSHLSINDLNAKPIWSCKRLKKLNLSHNRLRYIPAQVAHLTKLEHLDVSCNCLSRVSPLIGKLFCKWNSLELLLRGNPDLMSPPPHVCEGTAADVKMFYFDLSKGLANCCDQTVSLIGRETVGKTTLCRVLCTGERCGGGPQNPNNSTVGIKTVRMTHTQGTGIGGLMVRYDGVHACCFTYSHQLYTV